MFPAERKAQLTPGLRAGNERRASGACVAQTLIKKTDEYERKSKVFGGNMNANESYLSCRLYAACVQSSPSA